MNSSLSTVIVVLLAMAVVFAAVQSKGKKGKPRAGSYRRRKLMTDNEQEFFGRLVAALPDHYIFPQVSMCALIEAASAIGKQAHGDRLRIVQQRADYVVCTKSGEVVAVVELDDKTHVQAKDQLRDSRLEQAGIRTVRFQSRNKPSPAAIFTAIIGSGDHAQQPTAASALANGPFLAPGNMLKPSAKAE